MSWEFERAQERIRHLMRSVPQVVAQNFEETYLPRFRREQQERAKSGLPETPPLFELPPGVAVVVDTVQIYVNLINYDEFRLHEGRETERSHARALNFLHLHYGACDRVIDDLAAQRVDYHGPRVHAVVIEPSGRASERDRVIEGLELASQMMTLAELANTEIAGGSYTAAFRVGIDAGTCIAINSGDGVEKEPMFLGGAANHAAKLAEGDQPGIFVSERVAATLGVPLRSATDSVALSDMQVRRLLDSATTMKGPAGSFEVRARDLLAEWKDDLRTQRAATGGASRFQFHFHKPPLETIDYAKLSPANSIRMPLVSLFADLDGYTGYIDRATASGDVSDAVRALHVIRGELREVLEGDFCGRKVRFIGDCIHGLIAEGNSATTDEAATLRAATRCAGALRSSFGLCKEMLAGVDELGLAIGLELGQTPISRVGIRGERSVRLATSVATTRSEAIQRSCGGRETALGSAAYAVAPADVKGVFPGGAPAHDLDFPDAEGLLLSDVSRVSIISSPGDRAHVES